MPFDDLAVLDHDVVAMAIGFAFVGLLVAPNKNGLSSFLATDDFGVDLLEHVFPIVHEGRDGLIDVISAALLTTFTDLREVDPLTFPFFHHA